jgi:TolB-like protein
MKSFGLVISMGLLLFAFATMAAAAPATDVAIAPFSAIGASAGGDWIGKAVQQNLMADLARVHFRPTESAGTEGYVIRGSYQQSEQLIRFSGQLVEARSGRVVGGLSATGSLKDLFALEDTLSNQAIGQLRQLTASAAPAAKAAAPTVADLVQPAVAYDEPTVQSYVDADQAPSNTYSDQYSASRDRQMYQYNNYSNYFYGSYYGYGYFVPYYPRFGGFGSNGFNSGGTYGQTTR